MNFNDGEGIYTYTLELERKVIYCECSLQSLYCNFVNKLNSYLQLFVERKGSHISHFKFIRSYTIQQAQIDI